MIYIIGSGPGDPDLITVKGMKILKKAEVVVYAGSTVSQELLTWCDESCEFYNSASMTLEEVIEIINNNKNKVVVRLHSGDPAVYGAIDEEINALTELGISSAVIPGISAYSALSAELNMQLTSPETSQSILITRLPGKTPVPENLDVLLSEQPTCAIYLSSTMQEDVLEILKKHYPGDAILSAGYKVSRNDQRIMSKPLSEWKSLDFPKSLSLFLIKKQSNKRSKLYDPTFEHRDRKIK